MCEPTTAALLIGEAATAATATTAATAATTGLFGAAGAFTGGGALAALSTASAISGVMAQQNAADTQNKSNQVQAANALTARSQNANQVGLERLQATDAAGQKINANQMSLREAQATAIARAGPSGMSVDNLISDMGNKGATYNESVNANLDRTNMALDNQLTNVNTQASNTINQLKTPAAPDYLGAALKIGTAFKTST